MRARVDLSRPEGLGHSKSHPSHNNPLTTATAPQPPHLPPSQDLDTPQHHFTCPPTEEGLEVVQHLQRAVFGADGPQQSLAHCVYLATLAQVGKLD